MSSTISCYDCGRRYQAGTRYRCSCGEPLWYDTPLASLSLAPGPEWGVWGYRTALPVEGPVGIGAAAGGTPLVRIERLDAVAGCRIHVKVEGANPTGSFKDRGSAVGIASAHDRNVDWVATLSHGNMAMSVAAHATSAGVGCIVIVPSEISEDRFRAIGQFQPVMITVDDFAGVNAKIAEIAPDIPIEFLNADVPLRVEGQKTIAYEICAAMSGPPDAVVVPVASGGHASAIWKGLQELASADLIEAVPPLYMVQAEASDPIATAFRAGENRVNEGSAGETAAFSIVNKSPLSGNRALAAAYETNGGVLSIPERELLAATARMADHGGLSVEPASAITLAAVERLVANGELDQDDDVVLIATGTGFKELAGVDPDVDMRSMEPETAGSVLRDVLSARP